MKFTRCLCFASIVLALAVGACVNHVPIERLSCPCLDGYTCCDATNQCLPMGQVCPADAGATNDGAIAPVWSDAKPSKWQPLASWFSSNGMILPAVPFVMGDQVTFPDDYGSGRAITYRFAQNDWLVHPNGHWPGRGGQVGLVWTGSQVVYWGGVVQAKCNNLGGLYSLSTDTWSAINTTGAPLLAVDGGGYTGKEVVLRGDSCLPHLSGDDLRGPVIGALYNPTTDTWRNMSTVNAPTTITGIDVVIGEKVVCWGGAPYVGAPDYTSPTLGWTNSGAVYDAADDTWTAMSTDNAPSPRANALAFAMRGKMFVWGGTDGATNSLGEQDYFHNGGIFDPETNTWTSISKDGSPTLTADNGFWAEERGLVYVWATIEISGATYSGVALWTYDPSADRWATIDVSGLPEMLLPSFVWTGQDLLAFGGLTSMSNHSMAVLRYTP